MKFCLNFFFSFYYNYYYVSRILLLIILLVFPLIVDYYNLILGLKLCVHGCFISIKVLLQISIYIKKICNFKVPINIFLYIAKVTKYYNIYGAANLSVLNSRHHSWDWLVVMRNNFCVGLFAQFLRFMASTIVFLLFLCKIKKKWKEKLWEMRSQSLSPSHTSCSYVVCLIWKHFCWNRFPL